VVRVPGTRFLIGRWIDAGKRAEIMNEVRLIEVAGIQCDLRPFDGSAGSDTLQRSLETMYTAEKFGCQPDLLPENFDETAGAEACPFRYARDASDKRVSLELAESKVDGGMAR
jgi:hypothetical protein